MLSSSFKTSRTGSPNRISQLQEDGCLEREHDEFIDRRRLLERLKSMANSFGSRQINRRSSELHAERPKRDTFRVLSFPKRPVFTRSQGASYNSLAILKQNRNIGKYFLKVRTVAPISTFLNGTKYPSDSREAIKKTSRLKLPPGEISWMKPGSPLRQRKKSSRCSLPMAHRSRRTSLMKFEEPPPMTEDQPISPWNTLQETEL